MLKAKISLIKNASVFFLIIAFKLVKFHGMNFAEIRHKYRYTRDVIKLSTSLLSFAHTFQSSIEKLRNQKSLKIDIEHRLSLDSIIMHATIMFRRKKADCRQKI